MVEYRSPATVVYYISFRMPNEYTLQYAVEIITSPIRIQMLYGPILLSTCLLVYIINSQHGKEKGKGRKGKGRKEVY